MKIIRIRIVVIKSETFPGSDFSIIWLNSFVSLSGLLLLPAVVCTCLKWVLPFKISSILYGNIPDPVAPSSLLCHVSCGAAWLPVIGEYPFVQLQRSNKLLRWWWRRSGRSYCLMSWIHLQLTKSLSFADLVRWIIHLHLVTARLYLWWWTGTFALMEWWGHDLDLNQTTFISKLKWDLCHSKPLTWSRTKPSWSRCNAYH